MKTNKIELEIAEKGRYKAGDVICPECGKYLNIANDTTNAYEGSAYYAYTLGDSNEAVVLCPCCNKNFRFCCSHEPVFYGESLED